LRHADAQHVRLGRRVRLFMPSCHEQIVATENPRSKPTDLGCSNKIATIKAYTETPNRGCDMDMRELKALEIAARAKITFDGTCWHVPSQSSPSMTYRVTIGAQPSCQCEDFELRQQRASTSSLPGWSASATTAASPPVSSPTPFPSVRRTSKIGRCTTTPSGRKRTAFKCCCTTSAGA